MKTMRCPHCGVDHEVDDTDIVATKNPLEFDDLRDLLGNTPVSVRVLSGPPTHHRVQLTNIDIPFVEILGLLLKFTLATLIVSMIGLILWLFFLMLFAGIFR